MSASSLQRSKAAKPALLVHFSALSDPRQSAKIMYPLEEIMLLVVCATIAGADDLVEVREWGLEHLDFLRNYLPFRDDIPSHDTLSDVLSAIDPALFEQCFSEWVAGLREDGPDIIAVDGKTSRRTHDRGKDRKPLHLVSASWQSHAPHGRRAHSGWCSASRPPRRNPTRSSPFRCCSTG